MSIGCGPSCAFMISSVTRREMGAPEVEAFLSWLANERHMAVATHKQALSALVFLYKKVLGVELPWLDEIGRPKSRVRLPEVLTHQEVARLLMLIDTEHRVLAQLLYGTGMRIMEGMRLRVKDIDFERRALVVLRRQGLRRTGWSCCRRRWCRAARQLARARCHGLNLGPRGGARRFMLDALDRKGPWARRPLRVVLGVSASRGLRLHPRTGQRRRDRATARTFRRGCTVAERAGVALSAVSGDAAPQRLTMPPWTRPAAGFGNVDSGGAHPHFLPIAARSAFCKSSGLIRMRNLQSAWKLRKKGSERAGRSDGLVRRRRRRPPRFPSCSPK